MNVPDRIKKLTETFDYNLETYKKNGKQTSRVCKKSLNIC